MRACLQRGGAELTCCGRPPSPTHRQQLNKDPTSLLVDLVHVRMHDPNLGAELEGKPAEYLPLVSFRLLRSPLSQPLLACLGALIRRVMLAVAVCKGLFARRTFEAPPTHPSNPPTSYPRTPDPTTPTPPTTPNPV